MNSNNKKQKQLVIFAWRDTTHPEAGGAEVYAERVAGHFAEKGWTVIYLTSRHDNAKSRETRDSIEFIRKGNKFTIYLVLPLYSLFKLKQRTTLVIENYNAWPFLIPLWHRKTISILHHLQEPEWVFAFGPLLGPILMRMAYFLLRTIYSNQNVVTISESSKEEIIGTGIKPKRIEMLYCGIDDSFFEGDAPQKPTDSIHLVSLGRLKKHKRIDLAMEVLTKAIKEHNFTQVHFDIMGQGDQFEALQKKIEKLGIADYVTLHGFVEDHTRLKLLRRAHLHFQLAHKEGWGITVIEAASQGVPTICFNVPGLRDSVRPETGYIVEKEEQLYDTLLRALREVQSNDPAYIQKQKASIEWARNFSWDTQLKNWDILVEAVISE